MQARVVLAGLALGSLTLGMVAGCGPSARRVRAAEAVESTRLALTDLDARTAGSETPHEVHDALDRANVRLEETEHFDVALIDFMRRDEAMPPYRRVGAAVPA